jgi:Protein of unknown function (DUF3489)
MTFTIDNENSITAHAIAEEAAATSTTPFDTFTSQQELAELAAQWPAERLLAIWNSLPGVTPVKRFTDRKSAICRIWKRIQSLGGAAQPAPENATTEAEAETAEADKPNAAKKAKRGAQSANGAPAKAKATKKASSAKSAPKAKKAAKAREATAPRNGSKTATVVALLERAKGATLPEIMEKMGWQAHTVRGFMAGALRKAGHNVESFKPEGGQRTYRISR